MTDRPLILVERSPLTGSARSGGRALGQASGRVARRAARGPAPAERPATGPIRLAALHSLSRAPEPALGAREESVYQQAFHRAYAALGRAAGRLDETRSSALELFRELYRLPPEQRRLVARNAPRFASWGLAERLLAEAQRAGSHDPPAAEEAATLACEILATLREERELQPLLRDLLARAHALVGEARLQRGELQPAAASFGQARAHLLQGSGDPLEEAHLLEMEARLERARDTPEAAALALRRAAVAYRRTGETALAARALLHQAAVVREAGQPARALRPLLRARDLLAGGREQGLLLAVLRELIAVLEQDGRRDEAAAALAEARKLALRTGSRADLLALRQRAGRLVALPGPNSPPPSL